MVKSCSESAFTLIELIVASMLVVVVLMGIFSISNVLSNNNQDYGQRYLVRSETQATLNHILNNASLALGTVNANDEAILTGAQVGDANSFCIRQPGNLQNGVTTPNSNIINSNADIWLCYSLTNNNTVSWCAETYTPGNNPRGATSCAASTNLLSAVTFLGTANSMAMVFTKTTPLFSITLQNCLNNTGTTTCNGNGAFPGTTPGISSDPANNPEVSITGSVIPTQASSG